MRGGREQEQITRTIKRKDYEKNYRRFEAGGIHGSGGCEVWRGLSIGVCDFGYVVFILMEAEI